MEARIPNEAKRRKALKTKRRIPVYFGGMCILALGIVLIKKAELGISPNSAVPSAVSALTGLSFGNTTIIFQFLCILAAAFLLKKVDLKTLALFPLAIVFGFVIDLYVLLLPFGEIPMTARLVSCLLGIFLTALGIHVIAGTGLLLPGPDALVQAAGIRFEKPLGYVKMLGDMAWVALTIAIELVFTGRVSAVGAGTLASIYLTGKAVNLLDRRRPRPREFQAADECLILEKYPEQRT